MVNGEWALDSVSRYSVIGRPAFAFFPYSSCPTGWLQIFVKPASGMTDKRGIPGAVEIAGLHVGPGAPGQELLDADVYLFNGHGGRRLFDGPIHARGELRIVERKILRARGLEPRILGLGHEESICNAFHGNELGSPSSHKVAI